MKILIVDDKEEERYLAETLLKGSGYEVITAANGVEALEKLHAEGFDMIVSDILMPVMDGFQLCKECKEDEKLRGIPFVFSTAEYVEEEDKDLALKLGVAKFIRKPIEPDEFIKLIQGIFRDVEEGEEKPVTGEMKILIVEDNEDSRNLLVKQFHAYGHEVMAAADGAEALEQALVQPPDIIISDIMMPKMDGYQLCQECKQNDKLKNIPFVFYTATYTTDEDEKLGLSLGAGAFIRKPTDPDAIVQILSDIFEKAKSGALAPPKAPLEPSLFLTEYNKRIVAKLEEKMAQLEIEIIERKWAEEALQESEQKYRAIFNEARDGLVLIDSETGNIVDCNPEFESQTGRKLERLKKMKIWEVGLPEKVATAKKKFFEIKETGMGGSSELEFQKPDGEIVPIEFRSRGIDIKGRRYIQSIARDITERKRMEEQLIITDRLASIGELAAGIAHELNNPLTSVIGFAQLLLDQDVTDDVKEDVKIIYSEAQRTAEVVKSLLTFARKHPPAKQLLDINSIIEKALELRAYEQRVSNIKVIIQSAPDLPEIMADFFQLQQVFLNIIINAEYFMIEAHNRGTLTITTERIGDILKASFADDGPGISEDNIGHLFDPFFTTKEAGKGTGLGLSICHGIITEHGGRIYAESKLSKGATFVVELPITIDREGAVK